MGADYGFTVDGTTIKATGEIKNIADPWLAYDKTDNTGHFAPMQLPAALKGEEITLSGRVGGDLTATVDDDLLLVQRLENLTGDTLTIKKGETLVMDVDFSGCTKK